MPKRIEKIKAARSLNDIVDIIKDIAFEFKNSKTAVGKIVTSTSTEITFDVRREGTQQGKTGKQAGFVAPKLGDLQKHVDVIYKMYDNVVELDAAEAMIKQSFAGNKKQKAALDAIAALKKDIDTSINDAFDALNVVADKHLPTGVSKMADGITSHIIDVVNVKSYKDIIPRQTYVVPDTKERGKFHFCEYIGIEGLKNQNGHAYDLYYIVLTCVIDKTGTFDYFVNSFPDFKVPGKYPLGTQVKDLTAAKKRVDLLLSHNNFVTDFEKQPIGIDTDRANTMGLPTIKGVKSASVKDDELLVVLEPTVKTTAAEQKVIIEVLARLNAVVGARKNSKVFTYKPGTFKGSRAFKFVLVPNADKHSTHFSIQHMEEVSDMLGLSDKQKEALRFALQH